MNEFKNASTLQLADIITEIEKHALGVVGGNYLTQLPKMRTWKTINDHLAATLGSNPVVPTLRAKLAHLQQVPFALFR